MSAGFTEAQMNPLLNCLRWFGFFAYKLEDWSSNWKLKAYAGIVNSFILAQFLVSGLIHIETFTGFLEDQSNVTLMVHVLELSVTLFNAWSIFYCVMSHKGQIEFLVILSTIEKELRCYPFAKQLMDNYYRKLKIKSRLVVYGTVVFFLSLLTVYSSIFVNGLHDTFQVVNSMTFTAHYIFVATFVLNSIEIIQMFYKVINANLRIFLQSSDLYHKEIHEILKLHHSLSEAIHVFNDSFGVIL